MSPAAASASCPKHMRYGPCGGVRDDLTCEIGGVRCSFVDVPTRIWVDPRGQGDPREAVGTSGRAGVRLASAERTLSLLATRPVIVVDWPSRPLSASSITACAHVLRGSVDAVLAGDAGSARVQFPPAYRAMLLSRAGLQVWSGVNCRDRNRVALEGELAALADAQVAGVHTVTGDHTLTGHRPDARPVFDVDSTELASMASTMGHLVSVAESPACEPVDRRPERLAQKVAAGADVCFVNHCGGAGPAVTFARRCRDRGVAPAFVGCVPLVVDTGSAALLASFTSLVLPEGFLASIMAAADVRTAGIEAAVALASQMMEASLDGVNLSGGPGGSDPGADLAYAEALAETSDALGLR